MHRGDLHEALASPRPAELISLDKKLTDVDWRGNGVTLRFADGSTAQADAVIAADGIHSRVRELWRGQERANYTGRVAYRTTFPAALLNGYPIDECCKWWGPDRHIVIYYVTANRDEVYFVTSVPEPEFTVKSWSATGDLAMLRAAFTGFHEQVRRVVEACPRVHKWAIVDRDPLPNWGEGRMVLLGDAGHPMTQYMAQGAATAMEDAVLLTRCIEAMPDDIASSVPALRKSPSAAHLADPRHLAEEHLDARGDRSGLGLRLRRLDRAARSGALACCGLAQSLEPHSRQPQRVADHADRRQRHRRRTDHRRQQDAERRIEHAGGDRHACSVVDEGEHQVLPDVAHHDLRRIAAP